MDQCGNVDPTPPAPVCPEEEPFHLQQTGCCKEEKAANRGTEASNFPINEHWCDLRLCVFSRLTPKRGVGLARSGLLLGKQSLVIREPVGISIICGINKSDFYKTCLLQRL